MRVAAYTYKAEMYCPDCAVVSFAKDHGTLISHPAEEYFDQQAFIEGVDRTNESSFDSDSFPKVVFAIDLSHNDCGNCGAGL